MNKVYVVKQYQPSEGYNGEPIYIYEDEESAKQCTRNLNKTYSTGCIISNEGDFENYISLDDDSYHYYDYESMNIDKEIPVVDDETCIIEIWKEDGSYPEHWIGEKSIVNKEEKARQFNNWDEAAKYKHTIEALDVYKDKILVINRK